MGEENFQIREINGIEGKNISKQSLKRLEFLQRVRLKTQVSGFFCQIT